MYFHTQCYNIFIGEVFNVGLVHWDLPADFLEEIYIEIEKVKPGGCFPASFLMLDEEGKFGY